MLLIDFKIVGEFKNVSEYNDYKIELQLNCVNNDKSFIMGTGDDLVDQAVNSYNFIELTRSKKRGFI